jgi:alpha-amylase
VFFADIVTANCVAWYRKGDATHDGLVAVLCNGTAEGRKRIDIGKEHAGSVWTDVLGWTQGEVKVGDDGFAEFTSPAKSISVWVKADARGRDQFKE